MKVTVTLPMEQGEREAEFFCVLARAVYERDEPPAPAHLDAIEQARYLDGHYENIAVGYLSPLWREVEELALEAADAHEQGLADAAADQRQDEAREG